MISFAQFNTLFLDKPEDVKQFREGQRLYLFREGKQVCETPMVVEKSDACIGFLRMSEQRVCKLAKRGDDLRKEVA